MLGEQRSRAAMKQGAVASVTVASEAGPGGEGEVKRTRSADEAGKQGKTTKESGAAARRAWVMMGVVVVVAAWSIGSAQMRARAG